MTPPVLALRNLSVAIQGGPRIVEDVSLDVAAGEMVGLVGESGSGKSMTAYAALGLFPAPRVRIAAGAILLEGRDLAMLSQKEWRALRGSRIGMVFQDPAGFLDPVLPAGRQIAEALIVHGDRRGLAARVRALLAQVDLPESVALRYPHELSGGQKQRVLIAAALAMRPVLLIADEPTTALDVSVQAGILKLLDGLRQELGLAVLLISHDLAIVAQTCTRVFVMYAGQIVESGPTEAVFAAPRHPYTQGLLASLLDPQVRSELYAIPGTVPAAGLSPPGCRFHPRCPRARADPCALRPPVLTMRADGRMDRCWLADAD